MKRNINDIKFTKREIKKKEKQIKDDEQLKRASAIAKMFGP